MTQILMVSVIAMVADVVTGLAAAVKTGALRSGKMREGLWHKAGFCGLVAMGFLVEYAANVVDLGVAVPAASAVCVWVVATEAVSIIENLSIMSPQITNSPLSRVFGHAADGEAELPHGRR